jgi:20S proteasome alpha/beta subunit
MFRNNYDNDSVTFSPQGRIFQVEYASEAVKQGSVVVGLVSKTHAVLAAIKVRQLRSDIHITRLWHMQASNSACASRHVHI